MTPFRNNLEQARAEYQSIRYRGNLSADVLGDETISESIDQSVDASVGAPMSIGTRRNWREVLSIAAALAVGIGATFVVMRSKTPGPDMIAKGPQSRHEATDTKPVTPKVENEIARVMPDVTPSAKQAENNTGSTTAVEQARFTPVPDLSALASTTAAADGTVQTASASDFSLTVPSSPMLFSLASLAEAEESESQTDTTTTENQEPS